MHCKTFSSILGFYSLDANSSVPLTPAVTKRSISRHCQMDLGVQRGKQIHHPMGMNTSFELGNPKLTRCSYLTFIHCIYKSVIFSLGPQKQNSMLYKRSFITICSQFYQGIMKNVKK